MVGHCLAKRREQEELKSLIELLEISILNIDRVTKANVTNNEKLKKLITIFCDEIYPNIQEFRKKCNDSVRCL